MTGDLIPATDGLNLGSKSLRWNIPAVKSTAIVTNLNADMLDGLHRTSFVMMMRMMVGTYFAPAEVSVGTTETTVIEAPESVPSGRLRFYIPSFSATYRWTNLAGGNPTCRLRIDFGIYDEEIDDYVWKEKNYIEFDGVDLYKHPVALVRAIIDSADAKEWVAGVTGPKDIAFRLRAYTTAGTVAFGNRSFSGTWSQHYT